MNPSKLDLYGNRYVVTSVHVTAWAWENQLY